MFTVLVGMMTTFFMYFMWIMIAAIIGFYIFRNSRKYKMNTLLWVVVGVVLSFPGLCAYLIARKKKFLGTCPVCMSPTSEGSAFCPQCGCNLEEARPRMKFISKLFVGICTAIVIFSGLILLGLSL